MPTMYEKHCAQCGKFYRGMGEKTCSNACRWLSLRNRIEFNCKECGVHCSKPKSHADHSATEFCTLRCWYAFSKGKGLTGAITRQVKPCHTCGKEFTGRSASKFCSVPCQNKGRAPQPSRRVARIAVSCGICGKQFSKLQCQVDSGRGKFCSRSCRAYHSAKSQGKLQASSIETRFFQECKSRGIALQTQVRKGPFCIDAVSADGKVAFEFDGTYWHSLPRSVIRDARKDAFLSTLGMRVVRIPESLYRENPTAAIGLVVAAQGALSK